MSIPEACIEAAFVARMSSPADLTADAEARARRVILALAENLPDSAVKAALNAYWSVDANEQSDMRAAITAALKDVAGETP